MSRALRIARSLGDFFDETAERYHHDAIVFPAERATYPEIRRRSDDFARSLIALGVRRNDKVGLLLPTGLDCVIAILGIAKAGAVSVPVSARYKASELAHVLTASNMKLLVTAAGTQDVNDFSAVVSTALQAVSADESGVLSCAGAPDLKCIVSLGLEAPPPWISRADLERHAGLVNETALESRKETVRARDPAMFMFTSGTTSKPKAAILSHEAITRQFTNMAATCFLLTPDDKVWNALTFYHIGGIVFTFCCFAVGATCVHSGNFDAGVALKQLEDERCTVALPGFEVFWQSLIDHPDFSAKKLGPLRLINGMGVPERRRQLQAAFPGVTTITTFGATEACSFITSLRPGDPYEARMETLGSAMPGMEVRIRDLDGTGDAAPGVVGEILYRGPTLFDGYYGAPELTRQAIDCEGWFHSGDLGDLNAEGRLTFRGRLKDMLKVGGENVSPLEVEEFLSTHPAVLVAQVIGVPDAYYDEVPAAYLQLRPGMTVTVEDIISFCLGSIATFKIPRYVRVVEDWPMSATKIKKASLREELTAELEKAGIKQAPKITSRGAAKA